jgi:chaperonin GroES
VAYDCEHTHDDLPLGEQFMKRKDSLAAGAKSATFAGGVGEGDIFRNLSKEARVDPVIEITKTVEPRKKFIPNPDVLLVRPIEIVRGPSAIIIEQDPATKEKPSEGIVLETRSTTVPNGTHVVYGKYSGTEFKLNGEILLLLNYDDVLGRVVLEDESPEVEIEITPGTPIATA